MVWVRQIWNLLGKLFRWEVDIHLTLLVVRVYLINRDGELLILTRSPKDPVILRRSKNSSEDQNEPPGGCVDPKETIMEAASREVQEETGIDIDKVTIFNDRQIPNKVVVYRVVSVVTYLPLNREGLEVRLSKDHMSYGWISKSEISSCGLDQSTQEVALNAFKIVEGERGFSF